LKYETGGFITLGNRYPLLINTNNIKDIESYALYLEAKYIVLENWYKDVNYYNIVFNYCIITETDSKVLIQRENIKELSKEELLNQKEVINLPLNQLYKTWGNKVEIINTNTIKVLMEEKSMYIIIRTEDNNTFIEVYNTKNQLITMLIDKNINSREFVRYIDGKEYFIKDGKIFFYYQTKFSKMSYMTKLNPMKNLNLSNNTITLDTETYKDSNGDLQLYCISYYDGDKVKSYHLTDHENCNAMLSSVFNDLLRRKNTSKNIYIHNGSNFDLIFLLKYLANIDGIRIKNPLIKDGKFINIPIEYGPNYQYILYIKDSYLLLPAKLESLAKTFGTDQQKLGFDHTKINGSNLLEFKNEAIHYCNADCIALFQVLQIFNDEIYRLFKINISESPTLPSLAFRIFRTQFMSNIKIPILKGLIFKDLSLSYYGGHVDMYIPELPKNQKLYHYDVNSLYPHVMKAFKFPTKLVSYFIGDINIMTELNKINPLKSSGTVGFIKVKVTAPNILNPVLPFKDDSRTVYGQGYWTGWYYSSEILNAMKYGYKFEIICGYIFNVQDIFSGYIEKLYELKANSDKNSPKYSIAKLLMNSLYGRFGMSPILKSSLMIDSYLIPKLVGEKGIENILTNINLGKKSLITVNEDFSDNISINVAIASAVTSQSRVFMSYFKNNPGLTGKLFYSDTDSIYIEKELPKHLVDSKGLGLMKLENILIKFISLGPKVYGGLTTDGFEFTKVKGLKEAVSLKDVNLLQISVK